MSQDAVAVTALRGGDGSRGHVRMIGSLRRPRCSSSGGSSGGSARWRARSRGRCRESLLKLHRVQSRQARSNFVTHIGCRDGSRPESRRRVCARGSRWRLRSGSASSSARGRHTAYSGRACGCADGAANHVCRGCGGWRMLERRCEIVRRERRTARRCRSVIRLAVIVRSCSSARAAARSIPCSSRCSCRSGRHARCRRR